MLCRCYLISVPVASVSTVYCSIYDRNHRNDFDLEPRPHDLNRKRKSILQYFFGTNWCLWMWHLVGDVRVDDSTTDLRESRSLGVEDGTYLILLGVVELSFWNYGCHHVAISVIYTSYKYQILGYLKYTRLSILPIEIWTFFIVIQYAIQIYPWKN